MAPYNRRMNMQRMPKAEVVHIDPPKPPAPQQLPPPEPQTKKLQARKENGFLQNLFPSGFAAEDWLLLGLMLLFLQSEEEEYSMMLPALIYIFLG